VSRTPRDKVFKIVSKKQYLKNILARLDTEYIQILNLVTEHNLKHERGIGFWSLARIIFPVIEAVATTVGKRKEDFLEKDLQVPFGHLVWEIYRHALMHSDELRYAVYKEKTISWAIHLGNENIGHIVAKQIDSTHHTTIHLAVPKLYYDLQTFLIEEIAKSNSSKITVQVGVHFPSHKSKVIEELEEIYKNF